MPSDERRDRVLAVLTGKYMPGVYAQLRLKGQARKEPVELVGFLAIYREADGSSWFASGRVSAVNAADLMAELQRTQLSPILASDPSSLAPGTLGEQIMVLAADTALELAHEIMERYELPAAIAVFAKRADGERLVYFWYPADLVPPDRLFAAFVSRAMDFEWSS
ncbi:MAG TPA: hypothetical protein VLA88_05010 [Candidatus Saccharimonadales bacterium]|nr:hypothetical protein [Candidatus Saccharimonadales bacterium]